MRKNPVIIFAARDDRHPEIEHVHGTWANLKCKAIHADGTVIESFSVDAEVVIFVDDVLPKDLELKFHPDCPVYAVEHASRQLRGEQIKAVSCWPAFKSVNKFNHDPGTFVYELLKALLGDKSNNDSRKIAARDIVCRFSRDGEWTILNEFAIVQQIKYLCPEFDASEFEKSIKAYRLGRMLYDDLEEGVTVADAIVGAIAELNAASTA